MTTIQVKNRVLNKIQKLNDLRLLEEIYRLLQIESEDMEPIKLSSAQKKAIKQGQRDIAKGAKLSNRKADHEIDRWLKE